MSNLKKCPFCGGKPMLIEDDDEHINFILCRKCGIETKVFRYAEDAIKTWNSREEEVNNE